MLVNTWMTAEPVVVREETPLIEAYRLMHEYELRHLPVVRGARVVGIISSHDVNEVVLRRFQAGDPTMSGLVKDVMTEKVHTTTPDSPLEEAALKMHNLKIGALPVVVKDRELVGILTTSDLLEALAAALTSDDRGAVFVER